MKNVYERIANRTSSLFLEDTIFATSLVEAFRKAGYRCSISPILQTELDLNCNSPVELKAAPRLWRDRLEGRAVNPVQFIKSTYEIFLEAGTLARSDLLDLDRPLYNAYAQWVSRHPQDALTFAPGRKAGAPAVADPVEAIARVRKSWRASKARRREASVSTIQGHTPPHR